MARCGRFEYLHILGRLQFGGLVHHPGSAVPIRSTGSASLQFHSISLVPPRCLFRCGSVSLLVPFRCGSVSVWFRFGVVPFRCWFRFVAGSVSLLAPFRCWFRWLQFCVTVSYNRSSLVVVRSLWFRLVVPVPSRGSSSVLWFWFRLVALVPSRGSGSVS